MSQEQDISQLVNYIEQTCFPSSRRGTSPSSSAEIVARGLFDPRDDKRNGYVAFVAGHIAEQMFVALLKVLSSPEYTVQKAGEVEDGKGCDATVRRGGRTIGGFSIKSGQSAYDHRSSARPTGFPVIPHLVDYLEAPRLVEELQKSKFPDLDEWVKQRLYDATPRGLLLRRIVRSRLKESLPSEESFRGFVMHVVRGVEAINIGEAID